MEPLSRRAALAAGAAALVGGGLAACGADRPSAGARAPTPSTTVPPGVPAPTTTVDPARWVVEENALPGTPGWEVPSDPRVGAVVWDRVRGYASATSVDRGGSVELFVSTAAPEWRVEAYRIGWYGGVGARKVWESAPQRGGVQAAAVRLGATNTWVAPWQASLQVTADRGWPPGMYMLKLVSSDGGQSYVPLVVRDDRSTAAVAVQSSVTTWQAYNQWGGANLYAGLPGKGGRSDVVSFDRPYYRRGSGEFFGREYEFVLFAERHGYDVTYWTDVDLHADPARAARHRVVVSLGHDEYYSAEMRQGMEGARDAGTNLLFLGANGCFRKIRLEDAPTGRFRNEVNYRRVQGDPVAMADPSQATVSWREAPVSRPESSLIGSYYESNPVDAAMVVANPDSWILEGTGLGLGAALPHMVANEYDRVTPEVPTPDGIEVVCHSPLVCRGRPSFADVTWYTTGSGAGVFAAGTFQWIPRLAADTAGRTPSAADTEAAVQQATRNLLDVCAKGPAGKVHPSRSNLEALGIRPGYVADPPGT